jgi:hypothetical protein
MNAHYTVGVVILFLMPGCLSVEESCSIVVQIDDQLGEYDEVALVLASDLGAGVWQVRVAVAITSGVFNYCEYKDEIDNLFVLFTDDGIPEEGTKISGNGNTYELKSEVPVKFVIDEDGILRDEIGHAYAFF